MPKRVLTKVRRHYINREDDSAQVKIVDTSARYISDNNIYTLSMTRGLVEINRKIYIGPQYFNQYFYIIKTSVKEGPSKTLILNLCKNQQRHVIPNDYLIKRMESFGDLELAAWAHRVDKYQKNFPKLMEDYMESRRLENLIDIIKVKENVNRICQEIERDYSYFKLVKSYNRESGNPIELSFSEDFLKVMGHSIESILIWTKKNGIPPVFDHEGSIYYGATKKVLGGSALSGDYIIKGGEHETSIIDSEGNKRSVVVQSLCLVEPTEEGFMLHGYYFLKKCPALKSELLVDKEDSKYSHSKQKKLG